MKPEWQIEALAVRAILDSWKPRLNELIAANSIGLELLDKQDRRDVRDFIEVEIGYEEAQFVGAFRKLKADRAGYARRYWQDLADLKLLADGKASISIPARLGFSGFSPEAMEAANGIGIAIIGWRLKMMKVFFERNWNEDISQHVPSSNVGCGAAAIALLGASLLLIDGLVGFVCLQ